MIDFTHKQRIKIISKYQVGDIIHFSYSPRKGYDKRTSYSKIEKIVPKIEAIEYASDMQDYFMSHLYYVTENGKLVHEDDVLELIRRGNYDNTTNSNR